MGLPVVARIAGNDKWLTVAEARAEDVLSSAVAPLTIAMARIALALVAVERGDAAAAEEHYAALVSVPGLMVFYITTDRVLGLLSHTMGKPDQATAHFEDALAFCRQAAYKSELAWTCCDYADLLLQRPSADESRGGSRTAPTEYDRTRPMSLLEEALAISSELGMQPLMERVTERLERVQAPAVAPPTYPDGLTQREVEVLRLVAGGNTNLEIAEELVIAEGTARRHVANIYEKIGAANRAEATRYALQNGLLSLGEARSAEGDVP